MMGKHEEVKEDVPGRKCMSTEGIVAADTKSLPDGACVWDAWPRRLCRGKNRGKNRLRGRTSG